MIHLTYSNRTENLLDALAADLEERRAATHPLDPIRLVVPNRNVETWVKQGLASRLGIAANLEVLYLSRLVKGLLEGVQDRPLLDGRALQDAILSLLLDPEALEDEALGEVRAYLQAGGGDERGLARRRHQLALRLSRLYEEYGYTRAEMLSGWDEGLTLGEGSLVRVESWQRALWRKLLERRAEHLSLPQLLAELRDIELGSGSAYLFGISYVATAFHQILAKMAQAGDLHVYTLNPCREFWEDLETGAETARRRRVERVGKARLEDEDPFGLEGEDETPALSLWGRPGRENIRLLNELADCDFRAAFSDPAETPTLLQQVQRDILLREPERRGENVLEFRGDESVEILACPGIRREAEAIAGRIWAMVQADPTLRFNDIAVLVAGADAEAYFSHLTAAFEESYEIPYSLSDVSLSSRSRVAEGVGLLFGLLEGTLTRGDMLRFLTHPTVIGRFEGAEARAWVQLVDRLGIFHGVDRSDLEDTYLEEDLLTWDQGLRRLMLGAFYPGGKTAPPSPVSLRNEEGEALYLPEEGDGAWEAFGALVRSLLADIRFARGATLDTAGWVRLFEALVEAYVVPQGAVETLEWERCLGAIRRIAELSLEGRKIPCSLAVELVSEELGALPGGLGSYLAEGVAISTLQPMRAIPFRAIFVAGLGEGKFPAPENRDELDLRLARLRAGDVTSRESDQYMFLEAALCARDRLTFSYVSKNEQTGDPLPPSPTLASWIEMLERGYLANERGAITRTIPLRSWEAEQGHPSPRAGGERQTAAVREALLRDVGSGAGAMDLGAIVQTADSAGRARLQGLLGLQALEARQEEPERLSTSLSRIRTFLHCPLQGSVQAVVGLREEDEDLADRPSERFDSDGLMRSRVLRETFQAWLRQGKARSLESIYDELALRWRLAGELPSGVFGRVERGTFLETLQRWAEALEGRGFASMEMIRFGGGMEGEEVEVVRGPLELEGTLPIAIEGRTEAILDEDTSLVLVSGEIKESEAINRDDLRVFLDHVLLSAAGLREGQGRGLLLSSKEDSAQREVVFEAIPQEEARAYLRELVEDLHRGPYPYFLPWEAVVDWVGKRGSRWERSLEGWVEHWRGEQQKPRSIHGPIRNSRDYPALPEEEASEVIERRFGLFFAKRVAK